jgi:hypothetical protein
MTPSTGIQTPIERPSEDFRSSVHICPCGGSAPACVPPPIDNRKSAIGNPAMEFAGLKVFASRDGDRVLGHVDFPYPVASRISVPLAYRNRASEPRPSGSGPFDNRQSTIDNQAQARLSLVTRWRELCS